MAEPVPELLPDLRPPPGGLVALRSRLDRRRAWPPLVVAAALAVALLLAVRRPAAAPIAADAAFPTLAARIAVPEAERGRIAASAPVRLTDGSVLVRVVTLEAGGGGDEPR
ncbi:MAG: hypothetical protein R3F59_14175 [Myxococcota bacterium]